MSAVGKIGRNDPCPCGSGKKYKHCCLGKFPPENTNPFRGALNDDEDVEFNPSWVRDGGAPILEMQYLDSLPMNEISSPRMLFSTLLMPKVEELARSAVDKLLHRGREEAIRIEAATNLEQLIALMKIRPDPLNHLLLISRMLEFENRGVKMLLAELMEKQNTPFVELALKIIYKSGYDYDQEMETLICHGPRRAYLVALMCMILGMRGKRKHAKLLWDYYHMLKERFSEESYSDGPLIGLKEIVVSQRQQST